MQSFFTEGSPCHPCSFRHLGFSKQASISDKRAEQHNLFQNRQNYLFLHDNILSHITLKFKKHSIIVYHQYAMFLLMLIEAQKKN